MTKHSKNVFKNGPSKICGRQPVKALKWVQSSSTATNINQILIPTLCWMNLIELLLDSAS